MDYKKEYEKIIERLQQFVHCWRNYPPDNHSYEDVIDDLEYRVPELKESEDERVRKELIDFIRDAKQSLELQERDNNKWQIEQLEIYIAWLEKQGEQNPAWSEEDKTNINKLIGWTITMEHWSSAPLDIQELTKLREWLKALENKIFARKIERF